MRTGLAAVAAAGLVAAGAAAPANAQIISFCSGVAGAVTVPGDLIIRADDWCVLEGTTVQGNVTVRSGGDLVATDATFDGRVIVQADAYASLESTSVTDRVILRDAFGLLALDSTLGENVVARRIDPEAAPGAVQSIDSQIAGNVNAQVGAIWLGGSTVGRAALGTDVDYFDLHDTVVDGRLAVTGAGEGSIVCDSEVYGNAEYTGNDGPVQLGGDTAVAGCESANYWHGDVTINDTAGDVTVVENIVRRDLTGSGNSPDPVGEGNRVRGEQGGQFADLSPDSTPSLTARRAVVDRGEQLQAKLEARRDAAVQGAQLTGDAGL